MYASLVWWLKKQQPSAQAKFQKGQQLDRGNAHVTYSTTLTENAESQEISLVK